MKKIKLFGAALVLAVLGISVLSPVVSPVQALNPLASVCESNADSVACKNKDQGISSVMSSLVNGLLFVIGGLSVVMIIVAGVMYTISAGDSGKVSKAKNMLIYSIVGLLVAFFAFAIVNWVFKLFS